MKTYTIVLFILLNIIVTAQNTIGLLSYDKAQTYLGYTLIYPHNQPNVFLINNCGEIVHTWEDEDDFRPGNTAYLRPDGTLVKTKRNADVSEDAIWAGGAGAIVEILSWDNELIWSFEMNDSLNRLHHDIEQMQNGNILMVAWELVTNDKAVQAGRDPSNMAQGEVWSEILIEIDPNTDEVVWEWKVMDHLIQDFDGSKDNFGSVSGHKELIDFNWEKNSGKADWLHINSIDYNEQLDQIMVSVPYFNEIWIIDHTTSTAEAASHSGGFANHGGDLLYRIGNQQAYQKGDSTNQLLFFQHDAHWSNEFIANNHPDFGKVVAFNNRVGDNYSTVEKFESTWDMYISDYQDFEGTFPPYEFTETILHPDPSAIYSTGLSSAQLLPNGNTLICSGRRGYIVELNMEDEVVWEYKTPLNGGEAAMQGDTLEINNNLTFRAFKYPENYSAFDQRDLSPKGFIETDPDLEYCNLLTTVNEEYLTELKIFPNPASDILYVEWDSGKLKDIVVCDIMGRERLIQKGNGGMHFLDVKDLEEGIYFIQNENRTFSKFVVSR